MALDQKAEPEEGSKGQILPSVAVLQPRHSRRCRLFHALTDRDISPLGSVSSPACDAEHELMEDAAQVLHDNWALGDVP